MSGLVERLAAGPVVLADGAMGSLLQQRGFDVCLERLNLEAPDAVLAVHREYVGSGAEVLWTNSFGGSPIRLAAAGLADRTEEVNEAAARIARQAAGDRGWVAGSVGPCGATLAPFGDLSPEELSEGAARQIRGLQEGGVDVLAIETMMDIEEALVVLRTAREIAPELSVFVTLTFQETPSGIFTPYGQAPADAASRLRDAGADAVGANCGTGPATMERVLGEMRSAVEIPLIAKPNAGLPEVTDEGTRWPETPASFGRALRDLASQGAAVVGGCCGSTPEHIRALLEGGAPVPPRA